jgi:hypothetical protein
MIMLKRIQTNNQETAFQNYLKESEVGLEEFEDKLKIDKDDLDHELVHQSSLSFNVGRMFAKSISVRDAAKSERNKVSAALDREIRREASHNEEKVTEPQILSRIKENPRYDEINSRYQKLCEISAVWEALKESYQMRSYAIKDLVQLWIANYYTDSVGKQDRNAARDRIAGDARTRLSEARNRRE